MKLLTKREYILSLTFACFPVFYATAQDAGTMHQHIITTGIGERLIKDDFLSLPSARLSSVELAYSFSSSNAYRKKSIAISWGKGSGKASKEQLSLNEWIVHYSDAFSIGRNRNSRVANYLGYNIATNPQYIKQGDQYSWATVNTLSLFNSLVYSWNKNILSLDLAVPVAGFSSRPATGEAYKGTVNEMLYSSYSNLEFTSVHNLKAATIFLHYEKQVINRVQLKAGASFSYKDLNSGYHFQEKLYKINAGLSYRIK